MSALVYLTPDHPDYPGAIGEQTNSDKLPTISAIGNLNILSQPAISLFCSVKCPGDLILKTYDLAQALRKANIPVISGFHSPMEKECLHLLLRGTQPIIYCPARSLETMRLSKVHKAAIDDRRLLLLSFFPAKQKRATSALAEKRNQFVSAIASAVFLAYAAPDSKTESFARNLASKGKHLFTFDSPDTVNLQNLGLEVISPESAASVFAGCLSFKPN